MLHLVNQVLSNPEALGTWALVLGTWALALATWRLSSTTKNEMKKSLRTDALARLTQLWDSPDLRSARRHLARSLLNEIDEKQDAESCDASWDVMDFFEDLGALLRLKRLDNILVWHAFSEYAIGWWTACGQKLAQRLRDSDPNFYSEFESLCKTMVHIDKKRGAASSRGSTDDIRNFLEAERDLVRPDPLRVIVVREDEITP